MRVIHQGLYRVAFSGRDNLKITLSSGPSVLRPASSSGSNRSSIAALSLAVMSTSGSRMGIIPFAIVRLPNSNCCATNFLMPSGLAAWICERCLVPQTPFARPLSNMSSRPGWSFIIWTPSAGGARPTSLFKNGTTFFFFPQVLGRGHTLNVTIDGVLEQNSTNNASLFVGRIHHDFCSQAVHFGHHLILSALFFDGYAKGCQGFRAGATTLVKCSNEACIFGHLLQLRFLYSITAHLGCTGDSSQTSTCNPWEPHGLHAANFRSLHGQGCHVDGSGASICLVPDPYAANTKEKESHEEFDAAPTIFGCCFLDEGH